MLAATIVGLLILAYILGSLPCGFWLTKIMTGKDIRQLGSGSTGATNVLRNVSVTAGIVVLILDALKGYIAVYLGILYENSLPPDSNFLTQMHLLPPLMAIIALVGHSKSIFLGFSGGKSAATGLGTLMAMNMPAALCSFAIFLIITGTVRIVSIASMVAVSMSGPLTYLFHGYPSYVGYGIAGAIYVIYRHKSNIQRLIAGTEPKIKFGKKT